MKQAIRKSLCIALAALLLLTGAPLSGFVGIEQPAFSVSSQAAVQVITSGDTDEFTIAAGQTKTISVPAGETVYLQFVPENDGLYTFTSDASNDTYGHLYDAKMRQLASDDDGGDGYNFKVSYALQAGNTYYWGARYLSSSNSGSFDVSLAFSCIHSDENMDNLCDECGENALQPFGEGLTWIMHGKTLVISGEGAMPYFSDAPWSHYRSAIEEVIITSGVTSIGDSAFYKCTSLTSITIPAGVTSIGSSAFRECTSLASITIPDSVTSIGDYAFENCTSLAGIIIPAGVTSIGYYVFYRCTSLASITFGANSQLTSIGCSAFEECTSLASIIIPDGVKSIDGAAFRECTSLASITIPAGVTSIGYSAFCNCNALTTVTFGENSQLTSIGEGAFWNCYALANITIPDSVTSIESETFLNCDALADISVSANVTFIGDDAFRACTSLANITVDENNENYSALDGVLYNKDQTTLLCYPGGKSEKSFTIPDSVTNIGAYAFYQCYSLTSVTISAGVTGIGRSVFQNCNKLGKITILNPECEMYSSSSTIPYNTVIFGYADSTAQTYAQNYGRTFVDLAEPVVASGFCGDNMAWTLYNTGVLEISGAGVMENYGSWNQPWYSYRNIIETVSLSSAVTNIGHYAFYNCTNLQNFELNNLTEAPVNPDWSEGNEPEESPTAWEEPTMPGNGDPGREAPEIPEEDAPATPDVSGLTSIGGYAFYGCAALESITIPAGVTSIGFSAFRDCTSLASITIPDSVATIEDYTFDNCTSLAEITIPDGVTRIGYNAFSCCTSLASITIPAGVTSIADNVFNGCTSLVNITADENNNSFSSVDGVLYNKNQTHLICYPAGKADTSFTIPDSVTSIGGYAFSNCTSLASITIPDSVTSINYYAFCDCTSLAEITIPDSVTSIGGYAFRDCISLETVTFGANSQLTSIGGYAFENCTSLTSITIPDSVTSIGYGAFYNCTSLAEITIPDSVATIEDYTFYNCTSLASITIPDSVTSIGGYAFRDCTSLAEITIPDSVTSIGGSAFCECISLETVTFGANSQLTSIGGYAFRDCTSLASITIPDSVATIEDYAFYNCTALTDVVIPYSVTTIDREAFRNCTSLASITIINPECEIYDSSYTIHSTAKIIGYEDSAAQAYAETYNRTFEVFVCEHANVLTQETIAVTCTTDGYTAGSYCEVCHTWFEGHELIPATGHSFSDEWILMKAPTCATDGYEAQTCTTCGFTAMGELVCDPATYPETPHNYVVGNTYEYTFSYPGASELVLQFSAQTETESGCDYIYLCDATGVQIGRYSGTQLKSAEITIPGNSFTIKLTQDGSVTRYGFSFDSITAKGADDEHFRILPALNPEVGCVDENNDKVCDNCGKAYEVVASGSCGKNVNWTLYDIGLLSISGKGNMKDFDTYGSAVSPWYSYRNSIQTVVIDSGVKSIGSYAFFECTALASITIPDSVTYIGNSAFYNCSSLACVDLPEKIAMIGGYTFYNCESLTQITLPAGVTNIGYEAFYNCKALTAIEIPAAVEEMESYAFYGCTSLASVTFAENSQLTYIPSCAFCNCAALTSIVIPDSVQRINSDAFENCTSLASVTIPAGVTSIYSSAFSNCAALASITVDENNETYASVDGVLFNKDQTGLILYPAAKAATEYIVPDSVEYISSEAFYNAKLLESVTIPDGVEGIYDSTFYNCPALETVILPDSITEIGYDAFAGCTSLANITIPDNVTYIGTYAFQNCTSLASINIPDGVEGIYSGTFYGCSALTDIVLPHSVTEIGYNAFRNCTALASITISNADCYIYNSSYTIPSSATIIGYPGSTAETYAEEFGRTFEALTCEHGNAQQKEAIAPTCTTAGCTAGVYCPDCMTWLEGSAIAALNPVKGCEDADMNGACDTCERVFEVVDSGSCGDDLTWTVYDSGLLAINGTGDMNDWSYPYYIPWSDYSYSITAVAISDGVTSVGSYAFCNCYAIASIVIPDSVTSIGNNAFSFCQNLANITIPEGVTSIGNIAFSYCTSLASITIPDSVTSIGDSAFDDCSNLASVTFGENSQLTSIGNNAFSYCTSLASIVIPDSVTSIGRYAFYSCRRLANITIPDSVTSIGDSAFYNCYNLASVAFGENSQLTSIVDSAFRNCTSLASIAIPDSVTSIGDEAFYNCYNLASVAFGENSQLTSIGSYAFYSCSKLTSIAIPAGVISIGYYAFNGCSKLTSITIPAGVTSIKDGAFDSCTSVAQYAVDAANEYYVSVDGVLYNKDMTTLLYYPAEKDGTCFAIPETVTAISRYAFFNAYKLQEITIPAGITSIGTYAFSDCYNIKNIIIPDSVTSIDSYAFSECSSIESINIPNGMTSISNNMFEYCDSLTQITIPDSVTSIGRYAFAYCYQLTGITIPGSVTTIEYDAFYSCNALESITILNYDCEIPDSSSAIYDEAVIIGLENSTAQAYAEKYNREFVPFNCDHAAAQQREAVAPGCVEIGYTAGTYCPTCRNWLDGHEEIAATGHEFSDEWTLVRAATCTRDGLEAQLCLHCDALSYSVALCDESTYPESPHFYGNNRYYSDTFTYADANELVLVFCEETFTEHRNDEIYLYDANGELIGEYYGDQLCNAEITIQGNTFTIDLITDGSDTYYGYMFDSITAIIYDDARTNILPALDPQAGCLDENTDGICDRCRKVFEIVANGSLGETLSWVLNEIGTLTISGEGEMPDFDILAGKSIETSILPPWYTFRYTITKIIINEGVTNVSDYSFYDCSSATHIAIPESVTRIGEGAFLYCQNITHIYIPANVTYIAPTAFFNCVSLENITVDPANAYYAAADGVLYNKDYTVLCWYPAAKTNTSFAVAGSVTSINDYAFSYASALENITLPQGLTYIGDGVFYHCNALTSLVLPDGVTSIGDYAFYCCFALADISLPDSVEGIGEFAFAGCESLTGIVIPERVTVLENNVFENCLSLADFVIPQSITSIGEYAFYNCESLTALDIPFGVTTVENYAFYSCTSLAEITIPGSVEYIGSGAFCNCISLTSVVLPYSVAAIDEAAFYLCSGIKDITIPDNVTMIGDSAFSGCSALVNVFYTGSEEEWNAIEIGFDNEALTQATILFDFGSDCKHDIKQHLPAVEPTCDEVGFSEGAKCLVCGEVLLEQTEIPALGHAWDEGTVILEATCTEEGVKTYLCANDESHTKTETLPALGHTEENVEARPATCTEAGVTAGKKCSVCEEILEGAEEIPATGHTPGAAATCTAAQLCTVCGETLTEKTDHSYESVVTAPSCTEGGFTTHTCTVCGDNYTTDPTAATGHTWGKWIIVEDATDVAEGLKKRTCSVCQTEENQTILSLGTKEYVNEETGITVQADKDAYGGQDIEVKVEEVFDGSHYMGQSFGKIATWNIKTYVDGEQAQPGSPVYIRIPLPEDFNENKVFVYHINSQTGEREKMETEVIDGYICFYATSFSIFILVDESTKAEVETEVFIIKPFTVAKATESGFVLTNADLTVSDLLAASNATDVLPKKGENAAPADALATGMQLVILDGNVIVDSMTVVVLGDVDEDNAILSSDARMVLRNSVGLETLNDSQLAAADVDGDGVITAGDARSILRAAVGLDDPKAWLNNF